MYESGRGNWPFKVIGGAGWHEGEGSIQPPVPANSHPPAFVTLTDTEDLYVWQFVEGISGESFIAPFGHMPVGTRVVGDLATPIAGVWGSEPNGSFAAVSSRVFDALAWKRLTPDQPLDQNRSNLSFESAHQLGTVFGQRLHGLAKRTFYLDATRTPAYGPAEEAALSHDNVHDATALLKQLMFLGDAGHWPTLQAALKLLFDDIVGLEFKSVDGKLVPHVHFKYGEVRRVADTGFGLRNAIHLLVIVCSLPADAVLLIDEPEIGLNQQKQRDLARLLESIRNDVTLVLGTQSEPLIKGLSASANVILREQQNGATNATRVDTSNDDDCVG